MYQLTTLGRQSIKEIASFFVKCMNYLQRYTVGRVIFSNVINQILTLLLKNRQLSHHTLDE